MASPTETQTVEPHVPAHPTSDQSGVFMSPEEERLALGLTDEDTSQSQNLSPSGSEPATDGQGTKPEQQTDESGETTSSDKDKDSDTAEEDLLSERLRFDEKPEEKIARLERDLKGQSTSAQRWSKKYKALEQALKDMSLEVQFSEEDELEGLVPKKGAKMAKPTFGKVKLDDLTEEERDYFQDDPQEAINLIARKLQETSTVALPTAERRPESISPEKEEAAIEYVKGVTDLHGVPKNPNFEKNLRHVKAQLEDPAAPPALKDFYRRAPELALSLLNARVNSELAVLRQKATKPNEQSGPSHPDLGPSAGGGSPQAGGASIADKIGEEIANAGPVF